MAGQCTRQHDTLGARWPEASLPVSKKATCTSQRRSSWFLQAEASCRWAKKSNPPWQQTIVVFKVLVLELTQKGSPLPALLPSGPIADFHSQAVTFSLPYQRGGADVPLLSGGEEAYRREFVHVSVLKVGLIPKSMLESGFHLVFNPPSVLILFILC